MTPASAIDEQAIRRRAHERWLSQGCPEGDSERDWLEAERELRAEAAGLEARDRDTASEPAACAPGRTVLEAAPCVRRRAPRSIVTRAGGAPAAQWLVALAPEATRDLRAAASNGTKLGRR
jgi:hypothetical protein